MYMEVKLNRTYVIEKKYFEIFLKTTKTFKKKRNNKILYKKNNFTVKCFFEKLLEIHKVG